MFFETTLASQTTPTEDRAILTRTFWDDDGSDADYECFCKPIRTPLQNGFFGMNGYNCHPLQHLDR